MNWLQGLEPVFVVLSGQFKWLDNVTLAQTPQNMRHIIDAPYQTRKRD